MPEIHVNDGGVLRKIARIFVNDGGVLRELKEMFVNDGGALRKVFASLYITMSPSSWHGVRTSASPPSSMTLTVQADGVLHLGDDTPSDEDWNSNAPSSVPAELIGWTVTAHVVSGIGWTGDTLEAPLDLTLGSYSFTYNNNTSDNWSEGVLEITIDDGAGTSVTKEVTFEIRNGTPP